jgi:nucleoid-associated protein Lsr2
MAKQTITVYTDDVTGEQSDDIHTVLVLAGDGVAYQVDMAEATYAAYEAAIAPYVNAGRRVGRMPKSASGNLGNVIPIGRAAERSEARPDKEQNRAIREWWAKNQGREDVPALVERGRIPQHVIDAYQKHGGISIAPAPIEAPPEPPVKAAQTKRAPGTIGAETRVKGLEFLTPGAARPEVAPARKRTPAKAPAKAAPAKAARGKVATATVKAEPQPAVKRPARKAAAS